MRSIQTRRERRDSFRTQWGFIWASIGSAVGMGNLWRFPTMVSQWGGLTFLLPYFLFVLLIGSSGVLGEFALGRMTGAGPIGAFAACTETRGKRSVGALLGILPVAGSMALAIGYTVVVGWICKYVYLSVSGDLFSLGTNMHQIEASFGVIAPQAQSVGESLSLTLHGAGNGFWLTAGLAVTLCILAFGVGGGIEKVNKLMMPVLFCLLLGLAVYIGLLPGAQAGYSYIFTLNPAGLRDPHLWIFAFGQAFFSLSVAGNGSVIYGSYLPEKEDLVYSSRSVALFDTLAALLAAFVIIPAMAVGGGDLSCGGPGLMFVWLVNVFNGMPGGHILGILFFGCVLFAGLSSLINLYEAPVATVQEIFHLNRLPACLLIGSVGGAAALAIQGITSQWMDAVSIYGCPLGAAIAGILFFWVCTKDKALQAIQMGRAKPVGGWMLWLGRLVYVPLTVLALVLGAVLGGIG